MSGKIGKHQCPRCKSKIWFDSEDKFEKSLEQPYLCCPICFAPYKITVDKKRKRVINVERLEHQVEIPVLVTHPNGDKWTVYEISIPDNDFASLKTAVDFIVKVMAYHKLKAIRDAIPSFGYYYGMVDTETGIGYGTYVPPPPSYDIPNGMIDKAWEKSFSTIYILYHIYPFQVRHILSKCGLEMILQHMSTICPNCNTVIPAKRINNCPFCKKGETEVEVKNQRDKEPWFTIHNAWG